MKDNFKILVQEKTNEELVHIHNHQEDYNPDFLDCVNDEIKNRNLPDSIFVETKTKEDDSECLDLSTLSDDELRELSTSLGEVNPGFIQDVMAEMEKRKFPEIEHIEDPISEKKGSILGIIVGYIFSLLGGIIGIIFAYRYGWSTVKDSNGDEYYQYDESTRMHGKIMMYIDLTVIAIVIIIRFLGF